MVDEVKRMHYYNGLFLREEDFITEQNYHIQMRRLMNWYLNRVCGILEGLHVEPAGGKYYKVTPGTAISNSGKDKWFGTEIVQRSEKILDFSGKDPGDYFVTIAYHEKVGDPDHSKGEKDIHWIEEPIIGMIPGLPDTREKEIILAKVVVPQDVYWESDSKYINTNERNEIGPALRCINDKVGIGISSPSEKLEVNGTVKANKFVGDGSGLIKAGQWTDVPGGISYNAGKVGIGTTNPVWDLDISASSIKLGLEKSGGGQLVIKNNPSDDEIYLEAFSSINGSARALHITGRDNLQSIPALFLKADKTYIDGSVGVGTVSQSAKLEVNGNINGKANLVIDGNVGIGTYDPHYELDVKASKIKLGLEKNGGGQLIITNKKDDNAIRLEAHNSHGSGDSASKLILSGSEGKNVPWLDARADNVVFRGNVGIGTTSHTRPLVVRARGLEEDLIGFEDFEGTKWNINLNHGGDKSGLNFVETGVADGRLFIQAGGNVGIGTSRPSAKLNIDPRGKGGIVIGNPDTGSGGFTSLIMEISAERGGYSSLQSIKASGSEWGAISLNPYDGNVGIGTTNPSEKLEVDGTVKADKFVGDGSGLTGIKAGQWTDVPGGISYNAGRVGIGTYNPQYDLDVNASKIKLGLEKNGGGQLVITNNSKDDNSIYLEAQNSKGSNDSASEFVLSGTAGRNVPLLRANADDTIFSGNVGIGTTTIPDAQLHLFGGNGNLTNSEGDLKIGDENHRLKIGVVKSGAQAGDVRIRADGGKNRLMLGGGKDDTLTIADGKVGIGTTNPGWDLDISARSIKLGLEKSGGGQLVIKNNPGDDEIYLEAFSSTNGSAKALHITGQDNLQSIPALFLKADKTYIDGNLDVTASGIKLGLEKYGGGSLYIVNNKDDKGIYLEACGSADEHGNASFLTICGNSSINVPKLNLSADNTNFNGNISVSKTINANQNLFVQGNVGIGTTAPEAGLHIDKGDTNDLALKLSSNGPGWGSGIQFKNKDIRYGIYAGFSQFKICDANKQVDRLIIDDSGNIGIGTTTPSETLEVNGNIKVSGQIIQKDWIPPKLTDDWIAYNIECNPPGYFLDTNGIVHLRGVVKKTDIGTDAVIFNLPAGYRPAYREFHVVFSSGNLASRCDITPDGDVIILSEKGKLFSLDGVTFKVTTVSSTPDPKPTAAGSALTSLAGTQSVFYLGSDNHVYELAYDGSNWIPKDLTAVAKHFISGAGPAPLAASGSEITSTVISQDIMDVYYIGSDDHVYELAYRVGQWVYRDLTTDATPKAPQAATGSTLTSFAGALSVIYIGNDNHVYELAYDGSNWIPKDLTAVAKHFISGAGPAPLAASGSEITSTVISQDIMDVYYIGSDDHVYELAYRVGQWVYRDLTTDATPKAPQAATGSTLTSFAGALSVIYIGNDNHVYELAYDGSNWIPKDLTAVAKHFISGAGPAPLAASGSEITSTVISQDIMDVYYIGSDDHVYELAYRVGQWVYRDLTIDAAGPLVQLATASALTSAVVAGKQIIYCLGSNNHVYQLAFDGSNWGYKDLTKDAKWS